MTDTEEKGTLIRTYQPNNRSTRFFRIWLRMLALVSVILIIFVIGMMYFLFGSDWPLEMILIVCLFAGMEIVSYPIADKVASGYFRPTYIYTNGVDGYQSLFYRLKGIKPFLRAEDIVEVRVNSIYIDSAIESGKVGMEQIESENMKVNVVLNNGKSRDVARGTPEEMRELAEFMGHTWSVPIRDRVREYRITSSMPS